MTEPLNAEGLDYKEKYEKLKEFVRGKWTGDCSECAAIANTVLNNQSALLTTKESL